VTDFALLELSTSWAPKLRLAGDKLAAGGSKAAGGVVVAPPPPQEIEKMAKARKATRRIAAATLCRCSARVGI
jgi:hypothetical protein